MEVRTLPNGEQQIVSHQPQFPPAPALQLPGGFSKPAAAPLGGQSLAGGVAAAKTESERKVAPAPSPPAAPAADQAIGNVAPVLRDEGANAAVPGPAVCGRVRDANGRPAARALVTVLETGATTAAGADGAYCIDVPAGGGTLSVLAVGYQPYRVHLDATRDAAPVAVTLTAVDVLGSRGLAGSRERLSYRGQSDALANPGPSLARRGAIDASASAAKAGTVAAWTAAAERWETVARLEPPTSDAEPGFHAAEARVNAWLIGRTDARHEAALRAAAQKATQEFLDHAPAGTHRDIALGWNRVLQR
jgi:hypothetical protein